MKQKTLLLVVFSIFFAAFSDIEAQQRKKQTRSRPKVSQSQKSAEPSVATEQTNPLGDFVGNWEMDIGLYRSHLRRDTFLSSIGGMLVKQSKLGGIYFSFQETVLQYKQLVPGSPTMVPEGIHYNFDFSLKYDALSKKYLLTIKADQDINLTLKDFPLTYTKGIGFAGEDADKNIKATITANKDGGYKWYIARGTGSDSDSYSLFFKKKRDD